MRHYDDDFDGEDLEPEPTLFCANGHSWTSHVIYGRRVDDARFAEPDEDSQPECPECDGAGYEDERTAQLEEGWAECIFCSEPTTPPGAGPARSCRECAAIAVGDPCHLCGEAALHAAGCAEIG